MELGDWEDLHSLPFPVLLPPSHASLHFCFILLPSLASTLLNSASLYSTVVPALILQDLSALVTLRSRC